MTSARHEQYLTHPTLEATRHSVRRLSAQPTPSVWRCDRLTSKPTGKCYFDEATARRPHLDGEKQTSGPAGARAWANAAPASDAGAPIAELPGSGT